MFLGSRQGFTDFPGQQRQLPPIAHRARREVHPFFALPQVGAADRWRVELGDCSQLVMAVNYSISTLCVRNQLRSNSSSKSLSVLEARLRERFCLFSSLSTAS